MRHICLLCGALILGTAGMTQPVTDSQDNVYNIFRYLKIPQTEAALHRVTSLILQVEDVKGSESERVQDFKKLMFELSELMHLDTIGLNRYFSSWGRRIVRDSTQVFETIKFGSLNKPVLLEAIKIGTGKTPVILIPEFRKNWKVYKEFAEQNANKFTFYALTLPGYNGTEILPLPSEYDLHQRVWLDKVVEEVKRLIVEKGLKRPIVMGALNAGTYVGVNLANKYPNLISGVISLNGTINEDIGVPGIVEADRAKNVNSSFSNVVGHLLYRKKISEPSIAERLKQKISPRHPIYYYTLDTVKVKEVLRMHLSFPSITERYNVEWLTTDLTDDIIKLKVPMLVLYGQYDLAWPFAPDTGWQQWKDFKSSNPNAMVELAEIKNTRLILVLDKPADVAQQLLSFSKRIK